LKQPVFTIHGKKIFLPYWKHYWTPPGTNEKKVKSPIFCWYRLQIFFVCTAGAAGYIFIAFLAEPPRDETRHTYGRRVNFKLGSRAAKNPSHLLALHVAVAMKKESRRARKESETTKSLAPRKEWKAINYSAGYTSHWGSHFFLQRIYEAPCFSLR
jgi:hypothetical protein